MFIIVFIFLIMIYIYIYISNNGGTFIVDTGSRDHFAPASTFLEGSFVPDEKVYASAGGNTFVSSGYGKILLNVLDINGDLGDRLHIEKVELLTCSFYTYLNTLAVQFTQSMR